MESRSVGLTFYERIFRTDDRDPLLLQMNLFQPPLKSSLLAFCLTLTLLSGIGTGTLLGAEPQLIERAKKEGSFLLYTSMNLPDVQSNF